MRSLYLAGINQSDKGVWRYPLFNRCLLNVADDTAGVAFWLRWKGKIADIALFQGT